MRQRAVHDGKVGRNNVEYTTAFSILIGCIFYSVVLMYLVNVCNLYGFSAYSRVSHNSESGVESDDLLFPIEEVVDNASMENIDSESGNMTNHAISVHLCANLMFT